MPQVDVNGAYNNRLGKASGDTGLLSCYIFKLLDLKESQTQ